MNQPLFKKPYSDYYTIHEKTTCNSLIDYMQSEELKSSAWVFRAQYDTGELETTFERECQKSYFSLPNAPKIEENMIRQFVRVYDGDDRDIVQKDKLYCLSLMRHYGAPSRLLDFTYSKYVAAYFALEYAYDNVPKNSYGEPKYQNTERKCSVWCIDTRRLLEKAKNIYLENKYPKFKTNIELRGNDNFRNNETFDNLYAHRYNFVGHENPLQLHKRLHLQQGTFLCPGNIRKSFMYNLLYPFRNDGKTDIIRKVECTFKLSDLIGELERFMRMNITRESLFPGLDGFAQSMKYQIWFYKKLDDMRKGTS